MKNNNKISDLTNEELFQFYIEKDDMAYIGELYRRYIPKLYGLCLKYLGEKEIARDAVMDIFSGLPQKVRQYEINNFNTWLYSVAKNHCLQVIRKEKQTIFIEIKDDFVENDDSFTLNDKQQSQEEISALEYCLTELPEKQLRSIQLFYFEKQSYADIVDITGFTLSKVKSYIQNGKRNLKSCIVKVLGENRNI